MAWTTPRTWVTGETVTAALLNTHLRDNFNKTAPAVVGAIGDLVIGSGLNSVTFLTVGNAGQFLTGGSNSPTWTNELGSASFSPVLKLKGTNPILRWSETDAADPLDFWQQKRDANDLFVEWWDDSVSTTFQSMRLTPKDFILHTGSVSPGTGSVIIKTDTSGSAEAATTAGETILSMTINGGGAAFVTGIWSARVLRIAAGAASDTITFLPRDDGGNLDTAFQHDSDWAENNIPGNGDVGIITGIWYDRFTSTDTSAWQMFVIASTNSIFTYRVRMLVTSIQYPT